MSYVSASRVSLAERCPLAYRLRYLDRLPTVEPPGDAVTRDAGKLIHQVLEDLTPTGDGEGPVPAFTITKEIGFAHLKALELGREYTAKPVIQRAREILAKTLPFHLPEVAQRHVELKWEQNFAGLDAMGYMDRVDIHHDGSVRIVDYKTGKHLPAEKDPQIVLYLAAGGILFGRKLTFEILQLPSRKSKEFHWRVECQIEAERMVRMVEDAKTGPHPAKVTRLCGWCGYRLMCPGWRSRQLGPIKNGTDTLIGKPIEELKGLYFQAKSRAQGAAEIAALVEQELASRTGEK